MLHPSSLILVLLLFSCFILHPSSFLVSASLASPKKERISDQKVTFNFVDVELPTITKFISEITGKNFIFDERVKGKITIIAPTRLSIDDAFTLFTSVLELKGFTIVPSGVDAYKIIPSTDVKQRGIEITKDKRFTNESYIARLIPLNNISSDDVLRFVQPIVSKDGYVSAFGPGNLILVIDSGLNVEKILSIIEMIDQPSIREAPEIISLKNASADAVAKIINEGSARVRAGGAPGQAMSAEGARAVADQRLNAVILFGDRGAREAMKSLITLLDVPSSDTGGKINLYFLENTDATELAKVLDGIIKGSQPQRQAAPGAPPVTPFEAVGGITITPDKASNSLIIVASPADYQSLFQVIRQLDKRSRQVFVEVMVAEVSVNKLLELGTKWRATVEKDGQPIFITGFGQIDQTTINSIITGLSGFTSGGLGNFFTLPANFFTGSTSPEAPSTVTVPGFAAIFQLNDFKDVINVLSTPQILTSDNREAEIIVAENVPLITSNVRDLSSVNTFATNIERKDVGIILRITPQIAEGNFVRLNIYQEISAVVTNQPQQLLVTVGPTITKRSTKTSVAVQDRQTVVIGGLMQDRDEETVTKMPLLGDIPLLGWLFKTKSVNKTKTNLVVFITPHVVKQSERLAELTKNKHKDFAMAGEQYAQGELMVKFKDGVTPEQAEQIISQQGALVIKVIQLLGVYHIRLKKEQAVEDAMQEFSKIPEVLYAEPNYKMKLP